MPHIPNTGGGGGSRGGREFRKRNVTESAVSQSGHDCVKLHAVAGGMNA